MLARVDLGVPRHDHRGPELRVRARGARVAPRRAVSTCRRGGSRSTAPSRSIPPRSRRSARPAAPHGFDAKAAFPVFGMAEATLAVTFPDLGAGDGGRHRRPRRARARAVRRARRRAARATARRLAMLGRPLAGLRAARLRPRDRAGAAATARWASSSCAARRSRPATTRNADATAVGVPRRLVPHRRPRVPRRRAPRRVRPLQGHDHRRRPQRVPGGHRTGRGHGRRRPRRERHRVRQRPSPRPRGDRRRRRDAGRRRHRSRCATRWRPRSRDAVGVPPVDVVLVRPGTLPKTSSGKLQRSAVPGPLPRRRARTRLTRPLTRRHRQGRLGASTHGLPWTDAAPGLTVLGTGSTCARPRPTSARRELTRMFLDPARDHVRAAAARVLRAGLQLRRDVRRDPGARDRAGRRALRGRHRPQAAARAVHLRGDVRVLRDLRAVVGAGGRDARRRAHRAPARGRGAPSIRHARAAGSPGVLFVLAMVAFAPQDGQAANFEVFMLPSMTAAILFARRGRGVAAGVGGRARDAREADRRGHAAPRAVPARPRARASAASREVALGFSVADRGRRPRRRPEPAPLLGGARQRLVPRREQRVGAGHRDVRADDARLRRVQPPAPLEAAERVARPSRARARRRARHRPVDLALRRPRCRSGSGCGSSVTTTCSSCRPSRCLPRARSRAQSDACGHAPRSSPRR